MSTLRSLATPNVLIPLLTLAGAAWADRRRGAPSMVRLTDLEGEPILVRPSEVFVIHPSIVRVKTRRGTQLQILGVSAPVNVLETPGQVANQLGGNWVMLHSPGSWLGLGAPTVEVLIDPAQVRTVEPSPYRLNTSRRRLTDVLLSDGYKLQVIEEVESVARLLGM